MTGSGDIAKRRRCGLSGARAQTSTVRGGAAKAEFPIFHSTAEPPSFRNRMQVVCGLYAHAESAEQRIALLDQLEVVALEMAIELLEGGWRPNVGFPPLPPLRAVS